MSTVFNKSARMILAGVAIAAFSTSVYARGGHDCVYGSSGQMSEQKIERMEKMREAHQSELHEKLKLTTQQEPAWKKFISSHPMPTKAARMDRAEMQKLNTPQRMEKGLEYMRTMEQTMTGHLAALKEFYAVLTPEQQKVFDEQTPRFGGRGNRGDRGGFRNK